MAKNASCFLITLAVLLTASMAPAQGRLPDVVVQAGVYEVHLSPYGGVPVSWDIIDQHVVGNDPGKTLGGRVPLIDPRLVGSSTPGPLALVYPSMSQHDLPYAVERHDSDEAVVVRFVSPVLESGLRITRSYHLPREGFVSGLTVELTNTGPEAIVAGADGRGPGLSLGPGLGRPTVPQKGIGGGLYSYVQPVAMVEGQSRLSILEPEEGEAGFESAYWGGIHSRYFLAALIPELADEPAKVQVWASNSSADAEVKDIDPTEHDAFPTLKVFSEPCTILPGETIELRYRFFFGPKERSVLQSDGVSLDDVLFPGLWNWMRWLCFGLMALLNLLFSVLRSWGLSIIVLAGLVRVMTYPIAQVGLKQQATMARQQAALNAKLAEINEKWADDPTRKSQESWKVYKEHGVGPLSAAKGCLWLIIQIPIFIALFNLLGQSFALRGASFLWVNDLAEPDRLFAFGFDLPFFGSYFNILPLIMAGTQVFVTNVTSTPGADAAARARQKKFMFGMALLFLVLFYSFPSGLVLYWMMSNLGQLLQQRLVERRAATAGGDGGLSEA